MIQNYDINSLAVVYVIVKTCMELPGADEPSFMDVQTQQWYSINDLNQIINN